MHDLGATLALFFQAFVIALSGALAPGPLLTVTISEALGKGTRAGPLVVIGHGLAELALVSAVAAGLGPLLKPPPVVGTIGLVGGIMLLLMAAMMARGSAQAARQAVGALNAGREGTPSSASSGSLRCILLGAAASLSNPYWALWWITIGLALLTKALQISLFAVGAFYIGHILADLVWYWGVAFAAARGFSWLSVKGYRAILLACAAVLLGMGINFGLRGGMTLFSPR